MAHQPNMQSQGEELRRGAWLDEEDERLTAFVNLMGERRWDILAKASGKLINDPSIYPLINIYSIYEVLL